MPLKMPPAQLPVAMQSRRPTEPIRAVVEHATIPGAIASATAPWAIRRSSLHPIDLEKYD